MQPVRGRESRATCVQPGNRRRNASRRDRAPESRMTGPQPLIDAIGRAHSPAQSEARIVSLVPSLTELLFALGLGPRLVGRTGFCVHPKPEVKKLPKVGGTKDFD